MTPPELLHVPGSGLILYIFSTLADGMSDRHRTEIDELHQALTLESQWQSEKDFPIGAVGNGIVDGTKCQSTERRDVRSCGPGYCLGIVLHLSNPIFQLHVLVPTDGGVDA